MNKVITSKEYQKNLKKLLRKKLEETEFLSQVLTKEDINKIIESSRVVRKNPKKGEYE